MKYLEIKGLEELDNVEIKRVVVPTAEDYRAVWNVDKGKTISIVSDRYALVPHKVVANKIWMEYPDAILKVSENQARMYGYIGFREKYEIRVNDFVSCGLRFMNSYDKSASLSAEVIANRLICNNGMTVSERLSGVRSKHFIGAVDEFFNELKKIDLSETLNFLRRLDGTPAEHNGFKEVLGNSSIPMKYQEKMVFKDEGTLWDYLNSMSIVITHETRKCSLDRKVALEKEMMKVVECYRR